MTNARPKVFYGWWVALTAAVGLFLNTGTILVFTFGIYAKALQEEFGSGRAQISLAFTIHNLTAAFFVPFAGRLVDRFGPRRILLLFTFVLALILASGKFLAHSISQLYFFFFATGVVSGGSGAMPYTDVISHWFDRHRGLALSVMMLGMGLGAILIPPIAQPLVSSLGWRSSYAVFGFGILGISLPVVAAFLKERPENMGLLRDGNAGARIATNSGGNEEGLTTLEAVRTPAFWVIACAVFLITASVHACFTHLPSILADRGVSSQLAAFASSLFGIGLFLGRVGCGYTLDRFFAPRVAACLFAAAATGIALLAMSHALWTACVGAVLVGLGIGAEVDLISYLTTRYFGLRSYGSIFGWLWAIFGVSGGLGAYLMGFGFDKTGSYSVPLVSFLFAAAFAALFIMGLGPYSYRAAHA